MNLKTFWRKYGGITSAFFVGAVIAIGITVENLNPWFYLIPTVFIGWGIASFFNGDTKLK